MRLVRTALICFAILFLTVGLFAQTEMTTGVIQGTVTDPSGAVVPNATVEAKNQETNFSRKMNTDSNGRFIFLQLPPGRYNITISGTQGLGTLVQENVNVAVGQTVLLRPVMKVSSAGERITVTDVPTVDTTKTEASTVLNQDTIRTTPILGRKFEDLLTLTPGVSITQGPDGDEINFSGQRGIFNNVSLDGGDYNNGFFGEQMGGQRAAIDINLDAVQEFQVVASGANAEFGRTAGGIVNVVTKSGTNEIHGSLFHFQRLEALAANTSDGKPLKDFHREQFGGSIGGPIIKDKMFFFGSFEQVMENLTRDNLSASLGTCPVTTPTIVANEALIASNTECQRLALLNFFQATLNQAEGLPVKHTIRNTAPFGKLDWIINPAHKLSMSYNFDRSRNENQTFDVATYGNSANGIEGPSKIQAFNTNFFSTLSSRIVNEGHFGYSRETRPRAAVQSNVPPDTAMGFVTTFRFGNPFFLGPTVDELFWRTQIRDNVSVISGKHTLKFGGDWTHSRNSQVFRGFFEGRYIFDSVVGFLRYASPAAAGGFGPNTVGCSNGTYVTAPATCPGGATSGGPLLLYLQGAGLNGPATDAAGFSDIANQDIAFFVQDKWQPWRNFTLNYGLRWEAQLFPDPVVAPAQTAYGQFLANPLFPSDGTLPSDTGMLQPRIGFAWDVFDNSKSVLRASWGIFNAHQNMLTQVGSITTNGVQQQTLFANTANLLAFGAPTPTWPNVLTPTPVAPGTFPLFSGVRVFDSNYRNPRVYTTNVAYEQQLVRNLVGYVDFTMSKGVYMTRFVNVNNGSAPAHLPCSETPADPACVLNGNTVAYTGAGPFDPQLGETMVTQSSAKSLYRGLTVGARKQFSNGFQLEGNYVFSKDLDNDSNERDPFTDRTFNRFDFNSDYSLSDRDIRHKFNFFTYAHLPKAFEVNIRMQARSAQPITVNTLGADGLGNASGAPCSEGNSLTRIVNGIDCGRNHLRKDNQFFSFDWRVIRPIKFGDRYALVPMVEMFNTFNNDNNVNPLVSPGLFNFDGFLRQGVGDPRQLQLAVKFTF